MSLLQSIILGVIQGLTEFLPISSSAHLTLAPYWFGWQLPTQETFIFDVLVQVASLIAVIAYFFQDLLNILHAWLQGLWKRKPFDEPLARRGWQLILATLPAGMIGLLFKDQVEAAFSNPQLTAAFLLVTAGFLFLVEKIGKKERSLETLQWKDALFIGLAQAVAIFPGISRSGATIAGGMARDLERPAATRFAFLMSVPIMLAAGLAASVDLLSLPNLLQLLPVYLPGLLASAIVSYVSIRWLMRYVARRSLLIFSFYCALVGLITLLTFWV